MSPEVQVAVVAAVASVSAAIISLISSIVSSRNTARSAKAIEKLKHEIIRTQARDAISDSHLSEVIKALQLGIQTIQKMKDELQLVLWSTDSSLDTETAIVMINKAREQLFNCYEQQMPMLDDFETKSFHRAKNIALAAEMLIKDDLRHKSYASGLAESVREKIERYRGNLTEIQQLLRDNRTDRLFERISDE